MLSTEAAGLSIKIAKGLIKVTSRIDVILAEKEAVKGPLALPIAEVGLSPTQPRMRRALRRLLSATDGTDPDPLGTDRDEILDTVEIIRKSEPCYSSSCGATCLSRRLVVNLT